LHVITSAIDKQVMHATNFYIVKANGHEVIRDHKTLLQIKIQPIHGDLFVPDQGEITIYGIGRDNLVAFQTINVEAYDAYLMAFALAWYVDYSGQSDMFVTNEDPRLRRRLQMA